MNNQPIEWYKDYVTGSNHRNSGFLFGRHEKGDTSLMAYAEYKVGDIVQIGEGKKAECRKIEGINSTGNNPWLYYLDIGLQYEHSRSEEVCQVDAPFTHHYNPSDTLYSFMDEPIVLPSITIQEEATTKFSDYINAAGIVDLECAAFTMAAPQQASLISWGSDELDSINDWLNTNIKDTVYVNADIKVNIEAFKEIPIDTILMIARGTNGLIYGSKFNLAEPGKEK
jgi:hypothetical protein